LDIDDPNNATGAADCASRLYFICYVRNRRATNPEHLGQGVLRELYRFALGSVTGLQQPPAHPRFDRMQAITRRADPRLCEQHFIITYTEIGNGSA
jgi:hypothetical protein